MNLPDLAGKRIGFAMTGSFCTFERAFTALTELTGAGACVTPILSFAAANLDTRFFSAEEVRARLTALCRQKPLVSIPDVEPVGPQKRFDLLIVAPCTGNTCAKLAAGIADTPVTMAVKSHLRNERPVLVGLSTNDGLGANAKNWGALMARKHFFFVPFGQDDCLNKPTSLVFDAGRLLPAAQSAMMGRQLQPTLILNL